MTSESATESFATAFIQVHLGSILVAATVLNVAGILHGIASYLVCIHLLPALIYLLDIREGRVFKSMFYRLKGRSGLCAFSIPEHRLEALQPLSLC